MSEATAALVCPICLASPNGGGEVAAGASDEPSSAHSASPDPGDSAAASSAVDDREVGVGGDGATGAAVDAAAEVVIGAAASDDAGDGNDGAIAVVTDDEEEDAADDEEDDSAAADEDDIVFVKTMCGHAFCSRCIECVLSRPRRAGVPAEAPCPMCRDPVSLFDLTRVDNRGGRDLAYVEKTGVSSWPIANSQFEQRPVFQIRNAEEILQQIIDKKGAIEGHGIKFCFRDPTPFMELSKPLNMASDSDWTEIADDGDGNGLLAVDSVPFDHVRFHRKGMTFHGKASFANPIRGDNGYFYNQLDCLLHFSEDGHYIRRGNLRWKFTPTTVQSYPLDGSWEVRYSHGETVVIFVQRHFFTCYDVGYKIEIDPDTHFPHFSWGSQWTGQPVEQTSDREVPPGSGGPAIGEDLEWTTDVSGFEKIVWRRVVTDVGGCRRSVGITTGNFVYQRCNQLQEGNESPLGPSYRADTLWGNTFCQAFCVGLASYHFLEPGSPSDPQAPRHQAYISYESPHTEAWPSLDNGQAVPRRVPFRDIRWEPETRTFQGEIRWEEDYGTRWVNDSLWKYEIIFDPTFTFVVSGMITRPTGEPDRYGSSLVYINAALETHLREVRQSARSTGDYLDVIRGWRENGASNGTLEMLGEVAMSVLGDRATVFDFNL